MGCVLDVVRVLYSIKRGHQKGVVGIPSINGNNSTGNILYIFREALPFFTPPNFFAHVDVQCTFMGYVGFFYGFGRIGPNTDG